MAYLVMLALRPSCQWGVLGWVESASPWSSAMSTPFSTGLEIAGNGKMERCYHLPERECMGLAFTPWSASPAHTLQSSSDASAWDG